MYFTMPETYVGLVRDFNQIQEVNSIHLLKFKKK